MEFTKVLVIVFAVFHVSLSKPYGSEDELRVIVGQLERLVTSLRRYVVDSNMPEYPMSGIGQWSESTPEFIRPQFDPQGLYDKRDPFQSNKIVEKLLKPHFGSFPSGPYKLELPLRPYNIVAMLKTWYNSDEQMVFKDRTFYNVARELLGAHLQCASTRIDQIVFYVLKDQARAMTQEGQNMNTRLRKVLGNWITDTSTVEKLAQKIVLAAHGRTYGEIMDHITYFQFKDIMGFLAKIKMLIWEAEQSRWSRVMFDEKLNQLLTDNDFVFKCPSVNALWGFHQEIVRRVQERVSQSKPITETEAWLRGFLPTYITTDTTPAITAILQVYTDYLESTMWHLQQVENHVTTRNAVDITNFMSKFLAPHQLEYLQSILEILNTGDTSNIMMEKMGNLKSMRAKVGCTGFNGRCD